MTPTRTLRAIEHTRAKRARLHRLMTEEKHCGGITAKAAQDEYRRMGMEISFDAFMCFKSSEYLKKS